MKILIAEDDDMSRFIMVKLLLKLEHDVVEARNGAEAWYAVETDPSIQVVISDWMMPDLNGLELVRKIRTRRTASYVYVVMLTSLGGSTNQATVYRAGADQYLVKPIDTARLMGCLAEAQHKIDTTNKLSQAGAAEHTFRRPTR